MRIAPRINNGSASRYNADLFLSARSYLMPHSLNADTAHSAE